MFFTKSYIYKNILWFTFLCTCFSSYANKNCEEVFAGTGGEFVDSGIGGHKELFFRSTLMSYWMKHPIALRELGVMYLEGGGVKQDYKKARRLFEEAAQRGSQVAKEDLALMYWQGKGVERDDRQAFYWAEQVADQGFVIASYILGVLYGTGRVIQKSDEQSFYWHQKAAEFEVIAGGSTIDASHMLALLYLEGRGVEQNSEQAEIWFKKSIELGGTRIAFADLGAMYMLGTGVEKDSEQALYWWNQGDKQGDAVSQVNLGAFYYEEKQNDKAFRFFRKAAQQGNVPAMYHTSMMYAHGKGVLKNNTQSYKWLSLYLIFSPERDKYHDKYKDLAPDSESNEELIPPNTGSAEEQLSELKDKMTKDQIEEAQRLVDQSKDQFDEVIL